MIRICAASLLVATFAVAGCGASPNQSTLPDKPVRGLSFGLCNTLSDQDVTADAGMASLTRVLTTSMGCQWEQGNSPNSTIVSTWWYRGSPIADARADSVVAHDTDADVHVGDLSGFTARTPGGCSVSLSSGLDYATWSVQHLAAPDPCAAVESLARSSLTRSHQ
ncbi:DUF3558 family protein [Skermania sp. ID1734]|uniref:DUF3558 family protein n=1 Tax=Skermania sp. ID1734 TaxID=2597516 RepID=UPI00163DDA5F|nr:DUF3558 family protein [Skermania sp. ID1734]